MPSPRARQAGQVARCSGASKFSIVYIEIACRLSACCGPAKLNICMHICMGDVVQLKCTMFERVFGCARVVLANVCVCAVAELEFGRSNSASSGDGSGGGNVELRVIG